MNSIVVYIYLTDYINYICIHFDKGKNGKLINSASKDERYNVMRCSSAILSSGWMHLAASITHFTANKSSYFRLFICRQYKPGYSIR